MRIIDCPKIYNNITKSIDITEIKKFYIFYTSDDRNTISYIKSMDKLLQYNIEIIIANVLNVVGEELLKVTKETNKTNSKYIILKPIDDDLADELRHELKRSNEVDKDDALTVDAVAYILQEELKLKPQKCIIIGKNLGFRIAEKITRQLNYSPRIVHTMTEDIVEEIKSHNLIISTAGCKNLIKEDMVNENTIVIDVGLGDIEEAAREKCLSTPRINGVGLVTTAMLIKAIRS